MTREEYLDILQNNLHGIPPQEAENIMEYYREYFDDAGVENAEKVMQELGAPEQLAKRGGGRCCRGKWICRRSRFRTESGLWK